MFAYGPVVIFDIFVRVHIRSTVVTVVLAEGAEKILVFCHEPPLHQL